MEITFVSNDVLSLGDAASELDINRATLYRWIARNKATRIKLGKTPVILRGEVERLQKIGAKRKYQRHKPTGRILRVLQHRPLEETQIPKGLPKVKIPASPRLNMALLDKVSLPYLEI